MLAAVTTAFVGTVPLTSQESNDSSWSSPATDSDESLPLLVLCEPPSSIVSRVPE